MKATFLALVLGVLVLLTGSCAVGVLNTANQEANVRVQLEASQRNLHNEYDNSWKTVAQTAQVDAAYSKDVKDAYMSLMQGRTSDSGLFFKALSESNPEISPATKIKLMSVIEAQRDHFRDEQKKAQSLKAEDDAFFRNQPSGLILSLLGRREFDLKIVTSARTEEAFSVGKDDNVSVYDQK